eukprot:gene9694-13072_t
MQALSKSWCDCKELTNADPLPPGQSHRSSCRTRFSHFESVPGRSRSTVSREVRRNAPPAPMPICSAIGLAAETLMALEVGAKTGAAYARRPRCGLPNATAIASATGRHGPEPSSRVSQATDRQLFPEFSGAAAGR